MGLPKCLYHGTSYYRWLLIQQQGLKVDMPRGLVYSNGDKNEEGYSYFTDEFNEAVQYSIQQTLIDEQTNTAKRLKQANRWIGEGVILLLHTSKIKDRIEKDPESDYFQNYFNPDRNILDDLKKERLLGNWYRVKGDLTPKEIQYFRRCPLAVNSEQVVIMDTSLQQQLKIGKVKIAEGFDLPE